eukprot:287959-Chlamydomonas_euryale.AAC.2
MEGRAHAPSDGPRERVVAAPMSFRHVRQPARAREPPVAVHDERDVDRHRTQPPNARRDAAAQPLPRCQRGGDGAHAHRQRRSRSAHIP